MTTFDWTTAIAECCTHLAGLGNLPPPAMQQPALQAIAVLWLIADTPIQQALTPDSTIPALAVPRYSGRHHLVDDLLKGLTEAVAEIPRGGHFYVPSFSARNWIAAHRFDELVLRSAEHTADDTGRARLFRHTAQRAHALMEELGRLRDRHLCRLLERDLPGPVAPSDWSNYEPKLLAWLLAHQYDGDKSRVVRLHRRLQALRLYAGIADTLREPAITEVIDAGRELAPLLMKQLALTRAQLAALREATPPESFATHRRQSFERAVLHLQAHHVRLHQWPGGGRPASTPPGPRRRGSPRTSSPSFPPTTTEPIPRRYATP